MFLPEGVQRNADEVYSQAGSLSYINIRMVCVVGLLAGRCWAAALVFNFQPRMNTNIHKFYFLNSINNSRLTHSATLRAGSNDDFMMIFNFEYFSTLEDSLRQKNGDNSQLNLPHSIGWLPCDD